MARHLKAISRKPLRKGGMPTMLIYDAESRATVGAIQLLNDDATAYAVHVPDAVQDGMLTLVPHGIAPTWDAALDILQELDMD